MFKLNIFLSTSLLINFFLLKNEYFYDFSIKYILTKKLKKI